MNAVKKYGKSCIIDKVWYDHPNIDVMKQHEKILIKRLKDIHGKNCTNIAGGGDGNIFTYMSSDKIEKIRAKTSKTLIKMWKTPEYRNNRKCWVRTDEGRQHASDKFKELWKTEEYRAKVIKSLKNVLSGEKHRIERSERMKRMWASDDYRAAQMGKPSPRRGVHWVHEDQLRELWLLNNSPKHRTFRKIAVSNNFPDVNYSRMVDHFNKV